MPSPPAARGLQIHELGLRTPHSAIPSIEAAVALAIARGWLTGQADPLQAVSLTEEGRWRDDLIKK